jgi:hypothetical protein
VHGDQREELRRREGVLKRRGEVADLEVADLY